MERAPPARLPSLGHRGCSSTARAPAFQAGGAGSIPVTRSRPQPRSVVLRTTEKLILGAAALLFAGGTVIAIAKPGDLGTSSASATTSTTETTETTETTGTTSTTSTSTTSTTTGDTTTTTGGTTTSTTGGTTTTTVGTGPGDGMAHTGGDSMISAGMGLAVLALVLRRLRHA